MISSLPPPFIAQENYLGDSDQQEIIVMDGDYYSSFVPSQRLTYRPGATVEVARRHRGRPKGSKNKPKASRPPVPPRHGGDMMAPYILEVPHGKDIVRAISQFSIRKNTGLCVLTASGIVANASLCSSSAASAPDINCPGYHSILSMSAAFGPHQCPTTGHAPKPLTVGLTAQNGHVTGGLVFGGLVSMGPVYVIATSFNAPSYYKLSCEEEESMRNTAAGEGERWNALSLQPGGGVPMYSDNLNVPRGVWSMVTRPPQPAPSTPPLGI